MRKIKMSNLAVKLVVGRLLPAPLEWPDVEITVEDLLNTPRKVGQS